MTHIKQPPLVYVVSSTSVILAQPMGYTDGGTPIFISIESVDIDSDTGIADAWDKIRHKTRWADDHATQSVVPDAAIKKAKG